MYTCVITFRIVFEIPIFLEFINYYVLIYTYAYMFKHVSPHCTLVLIKTYRSSVLDEHHDYNRYDHDTGYIRYNHIRYSRPAGRDVAT